MNLRVSRCHGQETTDHGPKPELENFSTLALLKKWKILKYLFKNGKIF